MRMINTLFIAVVMIMILTACGNNGQYENLADYGNGDNGQYVYITIDGKVSPFLLIMIFLLSCV